MNNNTNSDNVIFLIILINFESLISNISFLIFHNKKYIVVVVTFDMSIRNEVLYN
jgi:hypothetical protein